MILEVCIIFYVICLVKAYNLSEDCSLRLGAQNQGFIVNCQGGKEQNEHFISHLRQSVLLPLIVKSALKTDLCAITSHLSQVTCSNPSSSDQTRGWCPKFATGLNEWSSCPYAKMHDPLMGESFWQNNSLVTHIFFELQPIMVFSPVANFGHHPLCFIP